MRRLVNIAAVIIGAGTVATVVFVAACWCCAKRHVWPDTVDIGDEPAPDVARLRALERSKTRSALAYEAAKAMPPCEVVRHLSMWKAELEGTAR